MNRRQLAQRANGRRHHRVDRLSHEQRPPSPAPSPHGTSAATASISGSQGAQAKHAASTPPGSDTRPRHRRHPTPPRTAPRRSQHGPTASHTRSRIEGPPPTLGTCQRLDSRASTRTPGAGRRRRHRHRAQATDPPDAPRPIPAGAAPTSPVPPLPARNHRHRHQHAPATRPRCIRLATASTARPSHTSAASPPDERGTPQPRLRQVAPARTSAGEIPDEAQLSHAPSTAKPSDVKRPDLNRRLPSATPVPATRRRRVTRCGEPSAAPQARPHQRTHPERSPPWRPSAPAPAQG